MTDKEKGNRVNALAVTFLEELQMTPHPFADQILRAYKAGYHQSEKDSLPKESVNKDFETALEKKVREAQDWTYIEEEGGTCPLNEEFDADDLEEFARWGADWVRNNEKEPVSKSQKDDALDLEIRRFLREVHDRDTTISDVARHFSKWQKERDAKYKADKNICCMNFDDIEAARIGAYEQGKSDMKQQMVKEVITGQLENGEDYLRIKCLHTSCRPQDDGKIVKLIIIKDEKV